MASIAPLWGRSRTSCTPRHWDILSGRVWGEGGAELKKCFKTYIPVYSMAHPGVIIASGK